MSDTSERLRSVLSTSERCGSQLEAANITDAAFAIADAIRHVGTDNRGVCSLAANLGEVADAIDRSGTAIARALDRIGDAMGRRDD
jgi:hypothetical protein